jgi:predicted aspartyl protease
VKKIICTILIISSFISYSQAKKLEKDLAASSVWGFFTAMEISLETIYEYEPELRTEINEINFLKTSNFPNSKKNAYSYLQNETDYLRSYEKKLDSLKTDWKINSILTSKDERIEFLKKSKNYLKGNIPSPMLENILSFEYQNQPHKEFVNGYTYTFNTKGHKKAKNTEISIDIPKSWTAREGRQPNVIQHFTSDCGNGHFAVNIMALEMPFSNDEINNLSIDEVNLLYKEIFTEEYAKNFIDGKFISFKPMNIAGRAGFLVVFEKIAEQMGVKIKMINNMYVFSDLTHIHFVNCYNSSENLEENSNSINGLFFMIVNSIVVPEKNVDIIELKGTVHQKIIDVKIAETNFDFVFDTGASVSLINKSIINNLLENGVISNRNFLEKKYMVTADGKKHLVELWNLPKIIIGGKKINNVDFAVMDGNITPLLGMNIINRLNIYKIDLENYKIYLKSEN